MIKATFVVLNYNGKKERRKTIFYDNEIELEKAKERFNNNFIGYQHYYMIERVENGKQNGR